MDSSTETRIPTVTLHDGAHMPQLGYGVWRVDDEIAASLVSTAIGHGYRLVDTAMIYENERGVGEGLRASGVARDDLYVTTKLWNSDHGDARAALRASLDRLGLEYVDLYLIHWPAAPRNEYVDAWRTLLQLRDEGLARSVGVSNFAIQHLERLAAETGELPVVNQVELHPYFQQRELRAFHDEHRIVTEAWSPLGQGGGLLSEPLLGELAARHGVTPAQVVLRWHMQVGVVAIPKTSTLTRLPENLDVFGFELSPEEVGRIAELDRADGRIGPDPVTAAF